MHVNIVHAPSYHMKLHPSSTSVFISLKAKATEFTEREEKEEQTSQKEPSLLHHSA